MPSLPQGLSLHGAVGGQFFTRFCVYTRPGNFRFRRLSGCENARRKRTTTLQYIQVLNFHTYHEGIKGRDEGEKQKRKKARTDLLRPPSFLTNTYIVFTTPVWLLWWPLVSDESLPVCLFIRISLCFIISKFLFTRSRTTLTIKNYNNSTWLSLSDCITY
jgi:hypothetical protein